MRLLILIAATSALVLAHPKPETYRETEDFQYSRSSSDDGTKSGYYGAQTGNMGGNYERAHNMDTLAQHQMSGLVTQVDGELGDGAKTRTGSVYTAANSRGIYGSGHYDLSNLKGRNFAEGESIGDSQSYLSSSSHNSRYGAQTYSGAARNSAFSSSRAQHSRNSGYQTTSHTDQRQIDNLQAIDLAQDHGRYESGNQAGYNMKYHTQYGSRGRSDIDQSNVNLHGSSGYDANSQAQYITTPVRVVVRPGGQVAIPISAPTYSISQNALSENKNAINTDAEVLSQRGGLTPTNKVKQYEASYSYRKQWEKHHELPGHVSVTVPTENPIPKNSELYEDAQLLQSSKNQFQDANSLSAHASNMNSDYRGYAKSTDSSQSRLQTGFHTQQGQTAFDLQHGQAGHSSSSQLGQSAFDIQKNHASLSSQYGQAGLRAQQTHTGLNSQHSHLGFNEQQRASTSGAYANSYGQSAKTSELATDNVEDLNLKPKSYHSSYSYHKSWERQGDPYVIKPVGDIYGTQASGKLTATSSNNAAYSGNQYRTQSRQSHQSYSADCENEGHLRVARSYNTDQQIEQNENQWEDLGQKQQNKWDNLQDLGQQTQSQWDNVQELGQETQNQWENLQQLGQQIQNQYDNLQQLGQQTQDKWDNLEDLGQQTQRDMGQHQSENLENLEDGEGLRIIEQQANSQSKNVDIFNQQSQKEDSLTNFEQQANTQSEDLGIFNQHSQKEDFLTNFEQQANTQSEDLGIFNQHSQKEDSLTNFEQQANTQSEDLGIFNQHRQKEDSLTNFEQQANTQREDLHVFNQQSQKEASLTNFEQANSQSQNLDIFNQHSQKEDLSTHFKEQANNQSEILDVFNQQAQKENSLTNFQQKADSQNENIDIFKPSYRHENIFNQQKPWFYHTVPGLNRDENIDSNNFMKPVSQNNEKSLTQHETEKPITVLDTHHLFTFPSTENKLWNINTEQYASQNTHEKNLNSFWNSNYFNSFDNQFENSFAQSTLTKSETGNTIQNLWDTVDNIAGGNPITTSKTDEKQILFHDNSNFNLHSQNVNHLQNGYNWNFTPANPKTEFETSKNSADSKEQNSEHNLINSSTQSSTTILPTSSTHHTIKHINDAEHDQATFHTTQKVNPEDLGRGDIGPEETLLVDTTADKPYKTPEEIEVLSLTKATDIPITQPTITKNTGKDNRHELSDLQSYKQENTNIDYEIPKTVQSKVTTRAPNVRTSTTMRNDTNIHTLQPSQQPNQPVIDVLGLNKNPVPDLQKNIPQEHDLQSEAIPDNVQQESLDQQYEEDFGQLQSSWFQTNKLQQGYDQQNMEQQFEVLQPFENMHDQTSLQDFGQHSQHLVPISAEQNKHVQENLQQLQNMEILSTLHNDQQKSQPSTNTNLQGVPETNTDIHFNHQQTQNNKKVEDLKSEDVSSPVETASENPGFWKSIGNKLSNAKSKVVSWFKNS